MILSIDSIILGYGKYIVLKDLSLEIPRGSIVSIIGPNGCGKSTLLKGLMRNIKPRQGNIYLEGRNIYYYSYKELGKKIAYLPQDKLCPKDIKVYNLISYGRFPHTDLGHRLDSKDQEIILWAAKTTGVENMLNRNMGSLSGGEKQRVWLAMTLAQQTDIIILDEPTTSLDISYQVEFLELLQLINKDMELTIIMVLHDINQASRYSDIIYVLKDGTIYDGGTPCDVIDRDMLLKVFEIDACLLYHNDDQPIFIPTKVIRDVQ